MNVDEGERVVAIDAFAETETEGGNGAGASIPPPSSASEGGEANGAELTPASGDGGDDSAAS
jgi:hypothetical protein